MGKKKARRKRTQAQSAYEELTAGLQDDLNAAVSFSTFLIDSSDRNIRDLRTKGLRTLPRAVRDAFCRFVREERTQPTTAAGGKSIEEVVRKALAAAADAHYQTHCIVSDKGGLGYGPQVLEVVFTLARPLQHGKAWPKEVRLLHQLFSKHVPHRSPRAAALAVVSGAVMLDLHEAETPLAERLEPLPMTRLARLPQYGETARSLASSVLIRLACDLGTDRSRALLFAYHSPQAIQAWQDYVDVALDRLLEVNFVHGVPVNSGLVRYRITEDGKAYTGVLIAQLLAPGVENVPIWCLDWADGCSIDRVRSELAGLTSDGVSLRRIPEERLCALLGFRDDSDDEARRRSGRIAARSPRDYSQDSNHPEELDGTETEVASLKELARRMGSANPHKFRRRHLYPGGPLPYRRLSRQRWVVRRRDFPDKKSSH